MPDDILEGQVAGLLHMSELYWTPPLKTFTTINLAYMTLDKSIDTALGHKRQLKAK